MKLLLIGAASVAALAMAAPAAAQYPPPPPPPSDADQYAPQDQNQGPDYGQAYDQAGQDAMSQDDQSGPPDADDQDDDQGYDQDPSGMADDQQGYGPPPGYEPPQSGQGYVPPAQDHYGPAEGGYAGPPPPPPAPGSAYREQAPQYEPPRPMNPTPGYDNGPAYEPGQDLVAREDRLERRIQRMAERGAIDPRSADAALAELRSIQDEQDRMMQSGRGLSPMDEDRLNQRLDALQQRVRAMRGGAG